jgi:hypothetical protein
MAPCDGYPQTRQLITGQGQRRVRFFRIVACNTRISGPWVTRWPRWSSFSNSSECATHFFITVMYAKGEPGVRLIHRTTCACLNSASPTALVEGGSGHPEWLRARHLLGAGPDHLLF